MQTYAIGRHKTKNPCTHWEVCGFLDCLGIFWMLAWSRQQESNLHLSLRRTLFYPLNYGEGLKGGVTGLI
jgi:hypothetical protein